MNFEPAKNYDGLLRQACSLFTLTVIQDKAICEMNKKDYSLSEKRLTELEESLASERAMNTKLTNELARHEMQPPETAPHDRRIIIFDDAGKSYCAEYDDEVGYGHWKVSNGFWFWNIAGWKEIP
jgi:hypothetical protein